jgi:hypothetical protein
MLRIQNHPNWRRTYSSGVWESNQPIGDGTYTLQGIDPNDGNLATPATDPVVLIGTGIMGSVRQKVQVTLVPDRGGLTCLEVAAHAGGDITFSGGGTVQCNQIISSNGSISETSSTINANVEAVGTITGTGYTGITTTGITPRTMPDSTVFDYYADPVNGTYIDVSMLPTQGGVPVLKNIVLSPANNPYSQADPPETNPQGIYVIDLMGLSLKIQNCRIVGTLVLLNGASDSIAFNNNNWEPAVPNYPVLMVRGDFVFNVNGGDPLSESSINVNFNPPGTPYNGEEDTLMDDTYPAIIKGLVYVSGNASITSSMIADSQVLNGTVIVRGTLNDNGGLDLTYQPSFLNNPPPGFEATTTMKVSPGSWQKRVD